MGKQVSIFLKLLTGLLLLAGLGLYSFRVALIENLLINQLARLGVPVNSLTVEVVSLNEFELRQLSLGAADELRADKISAVWTLPGLYEGELETVEISGLQLLLDLTGKNPPLGSLQKLIGKEGGSENKDLPRVTLVDAKVDLLTASGHITVNLNGDIKPGPPGTTLITIAIEADAEQGQVIADLTATLEAGGKLLGELTVSEAALSLPDLNISAIRGTSSFEWEDEQPQAVSADFVLSHIRLPGVAPQDEAFERGEITLQMNAADARIHGELVAAEQASAVTFSLALKDYRHQPGFTADVRAEVTAASVAWRLIGLPRPGKGSASLTLNADGKAPALATAGDNWRGWLQRSTLQGQVSLGLDGLGFAKQVAELNAKVEMKTELADGLGKLTLADGSSIEAAGLDTGWVEGFGIPVALLTEFKKDTKLRLSSRGENSASASIGAADDGTQMDLVTDLELFVDKARAGISARAAAAIDRQNQVTAFKVSEVNATVSGFKYAGNTIDKLKFGGSLQGSSDAWAGELDLAAEAKRFHLEPLDAHNASITLPVRVSFKEQGGQLSLRKPGQMTVAELAPLEAFRVKGPLELQLAAADIRFVLGSRGLSLENQVTLQPGSFTLLVDRDDAPALELEVRPGKISHTGSMAASGRIDGKSTISAAGITLPQHQFQLENITAKINHGESGKHRLAEFSIDRLQHLAPKPYFAPIALAGNVKLERERLFIDALGGIPGKQYLQLAAEHGLDTGEGNLKLDVGPLTFSPGTLQPVALFPDLAMLKSVSGSASASNHISWLKTGIESGAEIDIQNLSFTQGGTAISGLSAALQLTDLLSPKSLPRQKLTIRRIDPGVALENMEVIYQIQGTGSAELAIDQARLSTIGGTLSMGPVVIDPLSSATRLVLQVADLDLEALFELIDVDGLAGEGRLDGSIPLSLSVDSVSIEDGVLAAKKPGKIRLESETVSNLLAGSAEDVDLLLQALTDFHYTELVLKMNNSANNDLLTTLSLLGNNPKVLEGRPFRLNINLESNIGAILKALGEAYGVSSKALQRVFRIR